MLAVLVEIAAGGGVAINVIRHGILEKTFPDEALDNWIDTLQGIGKTSVDVVTIDGEPPLLAQGARGNGPGDFIGQYSAMVSRVPCAPSSACLGNAPHRISILESELKDQHGFVVKSYPNPFSSTTTIEFSRADKSSHAVVEIYTFTGSKVATLFNDEIEKEVLYKTEFNADYLPEGIYFYKIISDDQSMNGKLIYRK